MEIISGWLSQVSVLEWASLPLASDEETKPRKCVTCECISFKQQKECINNSVAPQLAAA